MRLMHLIAESWFELRPLSPLRPMIFFNVHKNWFEISQPGPATFNFLSSNL